MEFETRNKPIGFAQRTRKNLEYIRHARSRNEDVHVVTHLVNSMLGIVVVPYQHYCKKAFWSDSLKKLIIDEGWPKWDIKLDMPTGEKPKTKTLGHLVWHLRNAAAHGRFEFVGEQDSRNLSEVRLIVHDAPGKGQEPNWKAEIGGPDLYRFCLLLAEHIEVSVKSADGTNAG